MPSSPEKVEDVVSLREQIYDEEMADRIWPGTYALARAHLDAGQRVWLVTATPSSWRPLSRGAWLSGSAPDGTPLRQHPVEAGLDRFPDAVAELEDRHGVLGIQTGRKHRRAELDVPLARQGDQSERA